VIQVGTADIPQLNPFEVIPDALIGVEIGSRARQLFQMQALGSPSLEKIFDLLAAMDWRTVPDEQDRARDLAQEHAQEADHPSSIVGGRAHLHEESPIQRDATWHEQMSHLQANRLVFLDECGSNIALTPLYACASKGQRATGSVPRNRGKNTTLMASFSLEETGASMIIEGAANAAAFEASIEHILVPSLQAGQIVILDNLQVHKGARIR
jgi:hypothetical protein